MMRPDVWKRLLEERDELNARLERLTEFLDSPALDSLPPVDRSDLRAQAEAMGTYLDLLSRRIARYAA
ncbi:hypothetical protein FGG24_gp11 [Mycobacterium phage JC27]|uniref:Uncharacterized protein n=1 Tax=Mycobacterium phage JC27 TaxID=2922210 RepID=G1D360_9CAUD|nr:hypothetical protein PBI_PAPEZ_11 [Mycobacterium phage Papez]YP_009636736.1 hypothetical protein FGG24_gp11 [Mycobacterium phage JC27]AEK09210.1 hypothetical protein PBI_JC27_11 [Mycobacterium phage JC27]ANT41979.1 hypothetical protein PBI_PAPEZ_11 [Mycobacterium phage Papez]QGH75438.1 hypothetical protein SEA_BACONJACK_11 [Mycobacterium phage BaconJack]